MKNPSHEKEKADVSSVCQNFTFISGGTLCRTERSVEAMLVQPRGRGFSEPDGPEALLEGPQVLPWDAHSL